MAIPLDELAHAARDRDRARPAAEPNVTTI